MLKTLRDYEMSLFTGPILLRKNITSLMAAADRALLSIDDVTLIK
jgi:hypothetical protein